MNNIELSSEVKTILESRHKAVSDSRESDRIKAVLLSSEKWSTRDIAQALRIDESSVLRHLRDYKNSEKLAPKNGGSEGYLNKLQTQKLVEHLEENLYQHNHQIVAYVKERWGIEFSVPGMHKWLHRNNFVYKQPKGVPSKADVQQQEEFIQAYTELKSSVGADEPILFGDGVHPTQATKINHGWIKKGEDAIVKTTASRTRINLFGAIELGALHRAITACYDTINGESIVDFLPKIRAQYPNAAKIHLILDGAGYHKAKIVQEKAEELKIKIHILPPYSPNLNPIERLWKVMNKNVRNNVFFQSTNEFRQKIDEFFQKTLPDISDSLDSWINDNFERLSPASSS